MWFAFVPDTAGNTEAWRLKLALGAVGVLLLSFGFLAKWVNLGKLLGIIGCVLSYVTLFPGLGFDPTSTLIASVSILWFGWLIFDYQPQGSNLSDSKRLNQLRERSLWSLRALFFLLIVFLLIEFRDKHELALLLTVSASVSLTLTMHWLLKSDKKRGVKLAQIGMIAVVLIGLWALQFLDLHIPHGIPVYTLWVALLGLFVIHREPGRSEARSHWWEAFFENPARVMVTTFVALCIIGTGLLCLPMAASEQRIPLIDACFTAVSAVCVTGLVTLDTAHDFSLLGQGFILLLIQLGGLGIMSIASLAVHLMGKRFSLARERVFAEVVQTDRSEMRASLVLIFRMTFLVETLGAVLLSMLFYFSGDDLGQSIWRGVFTSISAFCNAGFALQTDSLLPYQSNGLVLQIISLLIIIGGMAPATAICLPKLVKGRRIPVEARIAWISTACLLLLGWVAWLVFESRGLLADLSLFDKFQNAWMQSATLRTAGFNSIELSQMSDPMYMFSMILMFIGGSPGGTAGGIKTTTIAIIAMTFWMRARNRQKLVYQNRLVQHDSVYQAITIFVAGLLVWVGLLMMLDVTQNIPMRLLAFETTSALGTVGLTLGATPMLDEIGKVIIILAMFAGRIGPLTLFMLISEPNRPEVSLQYPKADIHVG